jgi:hypothetical protein
VFNIIIKTKIEKEYQKAIKSERLFYYNSIIPPVSNEEMSEIISIYGDQPEYLDYLDSTDLLKNEN